MRTNPKFVRSASKPIPDESRILKSFRLNNLHAQQEIQRDITRSFQTPFPPSMIGYDQAATKNLRRCDAIKIRLFGTL